HFFIADLGSTENLGSSVAQKVVVGRATITRRL
ncbi:hypothetical protein VN97_g13284, partial [Penicillium thymicola]